ncbi:MAG: LptE family protein [Desulfuromonadaceae bacterium]|nr:LptE family protein [Desulfuromonadaceae bacterium]
MRAVLVALALLSLVACGYHLPGRGNQLPEDVQRLVIEVLKNKTTEPFIETRLTSEVRDQFARRPYFDVVASEAQADALLQGEISSYHVRAVAYDRDDEIAEYRATMTLTARLVRATRDEILWQGDVSWSEEFKASDDRAQQDNNETLAQEDLSRRLAAELYNRITDNF